MDGWMDGWEKSKILGIHPSGIITLNQCIPTTHFVEVSFDKCDIDANTVCSMINETGRLAKWSFPFSLLANRAYTNF